MPLPHFGGGGLRYILNEEKYLNERRRIIFNSLFYDEEINYESLEKMKDDFLEVSPSHELWEPVYLKN